MRPVAHVVVAVPVRDEELLLDGCLDSVARAVRELRAHRPGTGVEVVVVLDRCTDGSASVVSRHPVTALDVAAGSVGRARHVATRAGLRSAGVPADATWVAGTDADCVVPPRWLVEHVAAADRGADLVLGTVEPAGVRDPVVLDAWRALHSLRDGHDHVHGANLGVRASAYLEAGGFAPLALHEDVDLVARLKASGRTWVASDRVRVRTSGRTTGRVAGGFASYLAGLGGSVTDTTV